MPRRYITVEEQHQIIERAQSRCEYCQCPMAYSAQPFVFEHITAVVQGGDTSLDNLALDCGGCNGHKYTKVEALDPVTRAPALLYHPRHQQWQDHFA
jgi:5-methylcytosine-specific restriction endonuclease McrA